MLPDVDGLWRQQLWLVAERFTLATKCHRFVRSRHCLYVSVTATVQGPGADNDYLVVGSATDAIQNASIEKLTNGSYAVTVSTSSNLPAGEYTGSVQFNCVPTNLVLSNMPVRLCLSISRSGRSATTCHWRRGCSVRRVTLAMFPIKAWRRRLPQRWQRPLAVW